MLLFRNSCKEKSIFMLRHHLLLHNILRAKWILINSAMASV